MQHRLLWILSGALMANAGSAEELTLSGYDAFQARQKTTCGTTDVGKPRYGVFEGRTYARVPGEKDTHIFNVLGINVRHCSMVEDEERGKGFRSVGREIMVYMDPETNEILDKWENPWTGKTVDVVHVANDPVNMRAYRYEKNADGTDANDWVGRQYGNMVASSAEVPLFYSNPLGGEFQAYVGGTYHAMEIFNMFYDTKKLTSRRTASIGESLIAWSRVAQWLPWMEMGSKPGLQIFNATGFSTFDYDKVPARLQEILDERYPLYKTPPPLDDPRPNETSWTVFKKYMEGKKPEKEMDGH